MVTLEQEQEQSTTEASTPTEVEGPTTAEMGVDPDEGVWRRVGRFAGRNWGKALLLTLGIAVGRGSARSHDGSDDGKK